MSTLNSWNFPITEPSNAVVKCFGLKKLSSTCLIGGFTGDCDNTEDPIAKINTTSKIPKKPDTIEELTFYCRKELPPMPRLRKLVIASGHQIDGRFPNLEEIEIRGFSCKVEIKYD